MVWRGCRGEPIGPEATLPVLLGELAVFPARPGIEITDRVVPVDRGHLVRVGRSPVDDDQPPSGHALQNGAGREALPDCEGMELVPSLHGAGSAEKPSYLAVGKMKALLQELQFKGGLVSPEASSPDPGLVPGWGFGCHYDATGPVPGERKVEALITVPRGLSAVGPRCSCDRGE